MLRYYYLTAKKNSQVSINKNSGLMRYIKIEVALALSGQEKPKQGCF